MFPDVVHQEELVEALQKKLIWGAGLDVMTPEPIPHDHPLTTLPNVGKLECNQDKDLKIQPYSKNCYKRHPT